MTFFDQVKEQAQQIEQALRTIPAGNTYTDLAASLNLPAFILGPPALRWETYGVDSPSSARFLVYVIVAADDQAVTRLWELVPQVASTIDEQTDAAVLAADPAVYVSGTSQLPCYEVTLESPL